MSLDQAGPSGQFGPLGTAGDLSVLGPLAAALALGTMLLSLGYSVSSLSSGNLWDRRLGG